MQACAFRFALCCSPTSSFFRLCVTARYTHPNPPHKTSALYRRRSEHYERSRGVVCQKKVGTSCAVLDRTVSRFSGCHTQHVRKYCRATGVINPAGMTFSSRDLASNVLPPITHVIGPRTFSRANGIFLLFLWFHYIVTSVSEIAPTGTIEGLAITQLYGFLSHTQHIQHKDKGTRRTHVHQKQKRRNRRR